MTPFIVAEVSKTWKAGRSLTTLLLSEQFELVIEVNRQRGYRLHSFQMHQRYVPISERYAERLVETIIAVFERRDQPESAPAVREDGDPPIVPLRDRSSSSSSSSSSDSDR